MQGLIFFFFGKERLGGSVTLTKIPKASIHKVSSFLGYESQP